ncbi:hypothetical protein KZO01_18600 [Kurthia zopfii]|nr:hypothetical protein KZO01_18600 [Kurthia zopfii]
MYGVYFSASSPGLLSYAAVKIAVRKETVTPKINNNFIRPTPPLKSNIMQLIISYFFLK